MGNERVLSKAVKPEKKRPVADPQVRDAERYRWLRGRYYFIETVADAYSKHGSFKIRAGGYMENPREGAQLDAAIDRALKELRRLTDQGLTDRQLKDRRLTDQGAEPDANMPK